MLGSSFLRMGIGAACTALVLALLTALFPATAAAQEPAPTITLTTEVSGNSVDYAVTNIPNRRDTFPVIPGECTTVLVDTLAAAPALGTTAVETLGGRDLDALHILRQLIAEGAVTAGPRIQFSSAAGQVTGRFTELQPGVYLVATVCNVHPLSGEFQPELFDIAPVIVTGPRAATQLS